MEAGFSADYFDAVFLGTKITPVLDYKMLIGAVEDQQPFVSDLLLGTAHVAASFGRPAHYDCLLSGFLHTRYARLLCACATNASHGHS